MRIQLLISSVLIAVTAAKPRTPHIKGGTTSEAHSKPWLMNVARKRRRGFEGLGATSECGGSLIRVPWLEDSSDIVLTAAHCVGITRIGRVPCHKRTDLFRRLEVIASDHEVNRGWMYEDHQMDKVDRGEKTVNVTDGICHEQWRPDQFTNPDIALMKLEEPLRFTDTIKPIDLSKTRVKPGTECIIAGFGGTETERDGRPIPAKVLQELKVKVLDDAECKKRDPVDFRPEIMVCETSANGKGHACDGDSGGPLVCETDGKPMQYGLISFGNQPCALNVTAVMHTDVSAMAAWIEEGLKYLAPK